MNQRSIRWLCLIGFVLGALGVYLLTRPKYAALSEFGREFIEAYLKHGAAEELLALVKHQRDAKAFQQLWDKSVDDSETRKAAGVIQFSDFHSSFLPPMDLGTVLKL